MEQKDKGPAFTPTPPLKPYEPGEFVQSPYAVFVRSPYNYDMSAASDASGLKCEDLSLAVQEARDEVDINTLAKRFGLLGEPPVDLPSPVYGDFTGITNYHDAANAIAKANETFEELPPDIRYRFANDPGQFVDFCLDIDKNRDEMRKMGLLVPEATTQPTQEKPNAPPIPSQPPEKPQKT